MLSFYHQFIELVRLIKRSQEGGWCGADSVPNGEETAADANDHYFQVFGVITPSSRKLVPYCLELPDQMENGGPHGWSFQWNI